MAGPIGAGGRFRAALLGWRAEGYQRTRGLLVRGLGLSYAVAFGSLAAQLDGLYGRRGILPIAEYLDRVRAALGSEAPWQLPGLFWLGASDGALRAVCWGGVVLGLSAAAGLVPKVALAGAWVFYLSFTSAGQEFLGYQWDSLLLEAGLLGALLAPWGVWLRRDEPRAPAVVIWLFRWLVFRLMFLSGWVKLASGDPAWRAWEALRYHYETQPLPVWTSWYAHQAPLWFHRASVGFMFWAELIAPWLVFGPRPFRWVAFLSFLSLMAGIAATGNYGFFNALSVILCFSLLDDRDLRFLDRVVPPGWRRTPAGEPAVDEPSGAGPPAHPLPGHVRRVALTAAAGVIGLVTTMTFVQTLAPRVNFPWPMEMVRAHVDALRSTNSYGLFAVMTTERPEIEVEGSDDGVTWRPYRFRWKPGEPDRRPRFAIGHLPRLDWQMWFAALGGRAGASPWFLRFERRLLEGAPEVVGLLRENPFPDRPPKAVRARFFLYRFTRPGDRNWWNRDEIGTFCPPLTLDDFASVPPG